jgi:hypothetical protein
VHPAPLEPNVCHWPARRPFTLCVYLHVLCGIWMQIRANWFHLCAATAGSFVISYISSRSTNFPWSLPYSLLTDPSRPTFIAIFYEYHEQIVSFKQYSFYSILHYTYRHQNYMSSHRTDTVHWNKDFSVVCDLLHNLLVVSCALLAPDSSLLRLPEFRAVP